MARRLPKPSRLRRKGVSKSPKKRIIVVCEGRMTEPTYINDFAQDNKHPLVDCRTIDGVGVPKSIVDKALDEKRKLLRQARKSGDSFERDFEIWCLTDRDEHPNLFQQVRRAEDNGLFYALSNPCIELWGYLHFKQNDAPTHRHAMQKKLSSVMTGYDHKKNAVFNYEEMRDNYGDAIKRAKLLIKRRLEEDIPKENPSTNIYELLESIESINEEE